MGLRVVVHAQPDYTEEIRVIGVMRLGGTPADLTRQSLQSAIAQGPRDCSVGGIAQRVIVAVPSRYVGS